MEHNEERPENQAKDHTPPLAQTLSAEMNPVNESADQKKQANKKETDKKQDSSPPDESAHPWRKWLLIGGIVVGVVVTTYFLIPELITLWNTVSTDDAYVNGHVTFVSPRISGQVIRVLVDDNYQVKKGDILVQLDKEPFQVQADLKRAAAHAAEADLAAAQAQIRSLEALARSQRWQLQLSMQQVANQIANLRANVATYKSRQASLELARDNLQRGEKLAPGGGISKEDLDQRRQTVKTAEAAAQQSLEMVYAIRVSLGLPDRPAGGNLEEVPADLEQTYAGVRSALANLVQTMAQIGLPLVSVKTTPRQVLEEFVERDMRGDIDRYLQELVNKSPAVQQALARFAQARHDLQQAELNLNYCDIVSEIDGIVSRRNVNPGNTVDPQQTLMAVRSIREIWIDANFKENQLRYLRIGQPVRVEVDMYGRQHEFQGRITGFCPGTGAALSLLPPENATGNFVKIVQRLPVRIELTDYHPERHPLFVGLSVVPYVYYKEPATGPHAGEYLQPPYPLPQGNPGPMPEQSPSFSPRRESQP